MCSIKENIMDYIPVNEPLLDGNEKKYLNECIDTGWISSEGPFVKKFENNFAKYIGKKYSIAVSNGTAAIDISIEALNLKKNDEIIIPAFTIISCVNQIIRSGIKPIFVDCKKDTFNIDISKIESKITSKTKALMVVHIYGLPVDMNPVLSLAKKYNLKIIEDTAEVIGQTYYNKKCGSFGDLSTFSFYPNKHITTGEGGMILTDDYKLYKKCKKLRNLSFSENPDKRFIHHDLGWNYRMTNLQAAIGVAQLEKVEEKIIKKRQIGEWYNNRLKNISEIKLPISSKDYAKNIYWVYGILINKNVCNAKQLRKTLSLNGIGTRPFFYPLNRQPIIKKHGFHQEKCPNSFYIYNQGLYLPSGLNLNLEQVNRVCDILIKALNELKS